MTKKMFVIKDTKADYYHPPQLYRNPAEAIRAIQNALTDPNSMFAKNSEDFILFEIGDFSENSGQITPCDKKHVADIIDLVQVNE